MRQLLRWWLPQTRSVFGTGSNFAAPQHVPVRLFSLSAGGPSVQAFARRDGHSGTHELGGPSGNADPAGSRIQNPPLRGRRAP